MELFFEEISQLHTGPLVIGVPLFAMFALAYRYRIGGEFARFEFHDFSRCIVLTESNFSVSDSLFKCDRTLS